MLKMFNQFGSSYKTFRDRLQEQKIQPFSWQTALLLSLLSWFVYLLLRDPAYRQFVSIFGWGFLILGVDWIFNDQSQDQKWAVPFLKFKVLRGPWITGALVVLALWTNNFIIQDTETALTSWPLISAFRLLLDKFLKPGPKVKTFDEVDGGDRQEIALTFLYALLFSSWFEFHFVVNDVIDRYPSVLSDDFSRSAFVVKLDPLDRTPPSKGIAILEAAEAEIRTQLTGRSWNDVQRWLGGIQNRLPDIGTEIASEVFDRPEELTESRFWNFNATYTPGVATSPLNLQAIWIGPSSRQEGYILQRPCLVREAPVRPVRGLERPLDLNSFQMDCQPIESNLPSLQIPESVQNPSGQDPSGQNQPVQNQPGSGGNLIEDVYNTITRTIGQWWSERGR